MGDPAIGLERRGAATIVFGCFVAVGLVVLFAGTLTRATELEAEAARASAAVVLLEERRLAGDLELEFIESDRFVEQQARAAGFGGPDERPFRLPDDAPSAPPIPLLGESGSGGAPLAPFDAWVELLFGG